MLISAFNYADGNDKKSSTNGLAGISWYYTPNSPFGVATGFSMQLGGQTINNKSYSLINMNYELGLHFGTIRRAYSSGYFAEFLFTMSAFNTTIPIPQPGEVENIWGFNLNFETFHIRAGYVLENGMAFLLNYRNLPSNDFSSSMLSLSFRFNY